MVEKAMLLLAVVVILISMLNIYLTKIKGKTQVEILVTLKDELMKLFLYAEKQDWTSPAKMEWAVAQILVLFPDEIAKFIQIPLTEYVQGIYDEFRKTIYIEQAEKLGITVDIKAKIKTPKKE